MPHMLTADLQSAIARIPLTQAELAVRLEVDQSTISRWKTHGVPDRGPARIALERLVVELGADQ